MGKVSLEDLKPGMVLADDATASDGRMLLSSGSKLTERHIAIFKSWGLIEADIEGVSKEDIAARAEEEVGSESLEQARQTMLQLFQHTDLNHPPVAELFRACTLRAAQRSGGK